MSKGKWPRGFSISVTAMKTRETRVIVWRRNSDGAGRVKLMDQMLPPDQDFVFGSLLIGGKSNRRRVEVTLHPRMWPNE